MEDLLRGWLDRELAIASLLHDLRGPVAALQALVELLGPDCPEMVSRIASRLLRQLESFPATGNQNHPVDLGILLGLPPSGIVTLRVPPALLKAAIQQLPHREARIEVEDRLVLVRLLGVPEEEWVPDGIRQGSHGGRLRVAARLAGAVNQRYANEGGTGTVQLRFLLCPVDCTT